MSGRKQQSTMHHKRLTIREISSCSGVSPRSFDCRKVNLLPRSAFQRSLIKRVQMSNVSTRPHFPHSRPHFPHCRRINCSDEVALTICADERSFLADRFCWLLYRASTSPIARYRAPARFRSIAGTRSPPSWQCVCFRREMDGYGKCKRDMPLLYRSDRQRETYHQSSIVERARQRPADSHRVYPVVRQIVLALRHESRARHQW